MRYGYKCPAHGEFERNRPMAECSEPSPCPECETPSPRYYGYGMPLIFVNRAFFTMMNDVLPTRSDYEYYSDYLKETKDLARKTSEPSKKTYQQDKALIAEGKRLAAENRDVLASVGSLPDE